MYAHFEGFLHEDLLVWTLEVGQCTPIHLMSICEFRAMLEGKLAPKHFRYLSKREEKVSAMFVIIYP
jgi:hypothetical protein